MKNLFFQSATTSHRFIFDKEGGDLNGYSTKEAKVMDFKTDIRMVDIKNEVLARFSLVPSGQRKFAMLSDLKTQETNYTKNQVLGIVKELMPEYVDQIHEICIYLEGELFPTIASPSEQALNVLRKPF